MNKPTEQMAPTPKRECPHCHGSLERYEDPLAIQLLATERAAREQSEATLKTVTEGAFGAAQCQAADNLELRKRAETAEARLSEAMRIAARISHDWYNNKGKVFGTDVDSLVKCLSSTTPPPILAEVERLREEVRLLKVQISVADKAYNSLHERHQAAEKELAELKAKQ